MSERKLDSSTLFSIIVPVYNEEACLETLFARLTGLADSLPVRTEIVLVNDGSRDASLSMMRRMVDRDPRFRVIDLSRNFGHQLALSAGYHTASGDVVGVIDADLQDPPEIFREMLSRWKDGADVIYGVRTDRPGETAFKRFTAKLFYRFLSHLSDVEIPRNSGDFRVVDRRVIEIVKTMPERHRFLRGMIAWVGFRQEAFPYRREERVAGSTKYSLWSMARLSLDAFSAFSVKPLQLMILFGALAAFLGFALAAYYVLFRILAPDALTPGFSALFVAMLTLFGINFLFLGILANYVARSYVNLQGRPIFVIHRIYERDAAAAGGTASPGNGGGSR
jgi:dolichol-phosphate mannosyltransferase